MIYIPGNEILETIEKFGQHLCDIGIVLNSFEEFTEFEPGPLDFIIEGCPNLKNLFFGSYHPLHLMILVESLEYLSKRCKKLEKLKIINGKVVRMYGSRRVATEGDVKDMFPNCYVECDDCEFLCDDCGEEIIDCNCYDSGSDDLYTTDDDSYNSSFDDREQDSNSEGANDEDETNDILDDFDGGEIEFMFTGNKSGVKFDNKDKGSLKSHFEN